MNSSKFTKNDFFRAYRTERLLNKHGTDKTLTNDTALTFFFARLAANECLSANYRDRLACKKPLQILRAQKIIKEDGKKPNLFGLIISAYEVLTKVKREDINAAFN